MAAMHKAAIPVYNPKRSYDLFKIEIDLWEASTEIAKEKRGPVIALSLPDNDTCHLRTNVLEKVDKDKLKGEKGLEELMKLLDELLGEDKLEDSMKKYEDFEDYQRAETESIHEFIQNFESKYNKIKNAGIVLPECVLAFKLLRTANISANDKKLCLTGMDYTKKDELFVQAQKSLKKYCGGGSTGGGCSNVHVSNNSSPAIKVEKTESADVLQVNAGYMYNRGRGRGNYFRGRGQGQFWPHQRGRGQKSASDGSWRGGQRRVSFARQDSTFRVRNRPFSRGERNVNPLGTDGYPKLCDCCGSFRHYVEVCPDAWENQGKQNKVNYVEENENPDGEYEYYDDYYDWENPEECHVVLFTGDVVSENVALTTEAQNCAVLDTACTKSVSGIEWFETFVESLPEEEVARIKFVPSKCTFKFGAGPKLNSLGQYSIPATIVGKDVTIITDVVDADVPLLLSKSAMKKAGIRIDIAEDTAIIFGVKVNLSLTASGHYCIPITADCQVQEVFAMDLDSTSNTDRSKIFLKLHRQFGHPLQPKLTDLLKDAGIWKDEYSQNMDKVYDRCKKSGLCRFKRIVTPVVALPLSNEFNDKVCMDLKSWNGKWILHIIDMWSRYTQSTFISRKRPSDVIHAVLICWCSVFGFMKGLLTDNGGEFVSEEMLEVESILNLEVLTTAAESPFQNGICERNHQVVDSILNKLVQDYPKTPIIVLLRWACMAKNSLQMWSGFSSHQLVFGQNPNLPNFQVASVAALEVITKSEKFAEHMNALHAARKAFIETESCQKIKKALLHKVRTNETVFHPGDRVHYKRESSDRWLGPAKVIFQDGKVVFVRHGPVWVKVSLNRLAKVENEFNTSDDKLVSNELPSVVNDSDAKILTEDNQNVDSDDDEDRSEEIVTADAVIPGIREDLVTADAVIPGIREGNDLVPVDPEAQDPEAQDQFNEQNEVVDPLVNDLGPRRSLRLFNQETGFPVYAVYMVTIPKSQQNDEKCKVAKNVELAKLREFDVYEEVPYENQECISTRWVLWYKGAEVRARLVARGYEEMYSVQRDSPTVGRVVVRLFITLSAYRGWKVKITDIKSAFLQGKPMDRDVFITPPREADVKPSVVWKLKRCLYGLNDAARKFYQCVVSELEKLGCSQSKYDPALFYFRKDSQLCGILVSHVDDFLHAGNDVFEREVMEKLRNRFIAGKLMDADFCYIGFSVKQSAECIVLDQSKYVVEIPAMSAERMLQKEDELTAEEYTDLRRLVGSMNWIGHGTRPDIMFDLICLSMMFNKACVDDLVKAIKIARKLRDLESYVTFPSLCSDISKCELWVFTDAALGNLPDGHSSTGAYVIFLVDKKHRCCPLVWKANKIKRVVRSTLAAEALSLQEGIEEAVYIDTIIHELMNVHVPINAYVDNQSTVDAVYSTKMVDDRRLRIDIAAIKEEIMDGTVNDLKWIPDKQQLANCMTKKGQSGLLLITVLQTGRMIALQHNH